MDNLFGRKKALDHGAFVSAIYGEIAAVGREDGVLGEKLTHAHDTEVAEVWTSVRVTLGEFLNFPEVVVEDERERQQTRSQRAEAQVCYC